MYAHTYRTNSTTSLTSRYLGMGAYDGTHNYIIGGYEGTNSLATVERYDPTTNTWASRTSMGTAVRAAACVYHEGNIYIFGGITTAGAVQNIVQIYNIAGNSWSTGTNMGTPRAYCSAAVDTANDVILVFGGQTDVAAATDTVEAYNIAGNSWSSKAVIPAARTCLPHTAPVINNKAYIIGGSSDIAVDRLATNYEYDIAGDSWTTKKAIPINVGMHGIASDDVKDMIYVAGGSTTTTLSTVTNDTYCYEIANDLWTKKPNISARWGQASFPSWGSKCYFVGGTTTGTSASAYNACFQMLQTGKVLDDFTESSINTTAWTQITTTGSTITRQTGPTRARLAGTAVTTGAVTRLQYGTTYTDNFRFQADLSNVSFSGAGQYAGLLLFRDSNNYALVYIDYNTSAAKYYSKSNAVVASGTIGGGGTYSLYTGMRIVYTTTRIEYWVLYNGTWSIAAQTTSIPTGPFYPTLNHEPGSASSVTFNIDFTNVQTHDLPTDLIYWIDPTYGSNTENIGNWDTPIASMTTARYTQSGETYRINKTTPLANYTGSLVFMRGSTSVTRGGGNSNTLSTFFPVGTLLAIVGETNDIHAQSGCTLSFYYLVVASTASTITLDQQFGGNTQTVTNVKRYTPIATGVEWQANTSSIARNFYCDGSWNREEQTQDTTNNFAVMSTTYSSNVCPRVGAGWKNILHVEAHTNCSISVNGSFTTTAYAVNYALIENCQFFGTTTPGQSATIDHVGFSNSYASFYFLNSIPPSTWGSTVENSPPLKLKNCIVKSPNNSNTTLIAGMSNRSVYSYPHYDTYDNCVLYSAHNGHASLAIRATSRFYNCHFTQVATSSIGIGTLSASLSGASTDAFVEPIIFDSCTWSATNFLDTVSGFDGRYRYVELHFKNSPNGLYSSGVFVNDAGWIAEYWSTDEVYRTTGKSSLCILPRYANYMGLPKSLKHKVSVTSGEEITITCYAKKNSTYGSSYRPKLVVTTKPDSALAVGTTYEDTMSDVTDTWEQLEVSFTPDYTGVAEVDFYAYCNGTIGQSLASYGILTSDFHEFCLPSNTGFLWTVSDPLIERVDTSLGTVTVSTSVVVNGIDHAVADSSGNLYLLHNNLARVQKFNSSGTSQWSTTDSGTQWLAWGLSGVLVGINNTSKTVRTYNLSTGSASSLVTGLSGTLTSVAVDGNGRYWITRSDNSTILVYNTNGTLNTTITPTITIGYVYSAPDGNVWHASSGGVEKYSKTTIAFLNSRYGISTYFSTLQPTKCYFDADSNFYIPKGDTGTSAGNQRIIKVYPDCNRFEMIGTPLWAAGYTISSACIASDGKLWVPRTGSTSLYQLEKDPPLAYFTELQVR